MLALKRRRENFEITVFYERQVVTTWRETRRQLAGAVSHGCVGKKKRNSNAYCNFTFNAVNTKFDRNFN